MYDIGLGVTQDYSEAFKWYKLAAEQGFAMAQSNIGNMYYEGLGITQYYINAVEWYKLAA